VLFFLFQQSDGTILDGAEETDTNEKANQTSHHTNNTAHKTDYEKQIGIEIEKHPIQFWQVCAALCDAENEGTDAIVQSQTFLDLKLNSTLLKRLVHVFAQSIVRNEHPIEVENWDEQKTDGFARCGSSSIHRNQLPALIKQRVLKTHSGNY
jgi:hypothetical protein